MLMKTIISPSKYVQGPGAVAEVGKYAAQMGGRALVIGGRTALEAAQGPLVAGLEAAGMKVDVQLFRGESSWEEVGRLVALANATGAAVVIGVGGGKVLDTAKVVGRDIGARWINVPTTVATNAACSAVAVIYSPEGVFEEYVFLPRNPDLVVADTSILINNPAHMLRMGMGDCLAGWIEGETCALTAKPNFAGGTAPITALAIAKLCYETLLTYGLDALRAAEVQAATPAYERIVEAVLLMGALGFESTGLAAAHAIHNGFTVLAETHSISHGEKVAFGVLAMLVLENRPKSQIDEVLCFLDAIDLPMTLAQLKITDKGAELDRKLFEVGKAACAEGDTMYCEPMPVTPETAMYAIKGADAIGRAYRAGKG
ncbi:MAG: glycerol dehydrogenase [Actinobacteria bacterium]|nr:glycerol dehydrogenase [Actinomycetota bacterium]